MERQRNLPLTFTYIVQFLSSWPRAESDDGGCFNIEDKRWLVSVYKLLKVKSYLRFVANQLPQYLGVLLQSYNNRFGSRPLEKNQSVK